MSYLVRNPDAGPRPGSPPVKPKRPEPSPLRVVKEGGDPWFWGAVGRSFARLGMAIGWLCSRLAWGRVEPFTSGWLSLCTRTYVRVQASEPPAHVFPYSTTGGPAGMPPPKTGNYIYR